MNSRDQYEIIGLHKIIKQLCSGVSQYLTNNVVPWLNKAKIEYFDLQQALKISNLAQILSA